MGKSYVLSGAQVRVYVSGKPFTEIQSITWTIDYGETEIYGVDSPFPQEIAPTRVSVQGTVKGVRVKSTGGLQGHLARYKIADILSAPYTSLEVRQRGGMKERLLWLPQMKVTRESLDTSVKNVVRFTFSFKGIIPYNPLDFKND